MTTDEVYQYEIETTDRDNDQVLLSLSSGPDGMTLEDNTLNWQPTKVGIYNVVLEASDQNNGYDTQAWQITVGPGAITSIVITPNDRPTIVNIGDSQLFTAIAYDQYNNELPKAELTWLTDEEIGSIDQRGLFLAKKGGLGFVAIENGNVKTSIGVVVKDIRSTLVTEQDTSQEKIVTETTTTTPTRTATEPEETTEEVIEESVIAGAETEETVETTTEEEEPCTNPAHWLTILMLIVYTIMLLVYYQYEKKHKSNAWWIFPFLLTFIGLLVYYRYICPQTYLWWPWLMVSLGVIITLYYKGRKKSQTSKPDDQTQLPF